MGRNNITKTSLTVETFILKTVEAIYANIAKKGINKVYLIVESG